MRLGKTNPAGGTIKFTIVNAFVLAFAVSVTPRPAHAQQANNTWTGANNNRDWSDALNWSAGRWPENGGGVPIGGGGMS